jgi:hypothetical protein
MTLRHPGYTKYHDERDVVEFGGPHKMTSTINHLDETLALISPNATETTVS